VELSADPGARGSKSNKKDKKQKEEINAAEKRI
jgi:hypothetical protein